MVSVVSTQRLRSLTKPNVSMASLPQSQITDAQFQNRNFSLSPPIALNDVVRREISDSAMKNLPAQMKTHTTAFRSPEQQIEVIQKPDDCEDQPPR